MSTIKASFATEGRYVNKIFSLCSYCDYFSKHFFISFSINVAMLVRVYRSFFRRHI